MKWPADFDLGVFEFLLLLVVGRLDDSRALSH
jgi:hypothetical protein